MIVPCAIPYTASGYRTCVFDQRGQGLGSLGPLSPALLLLLLVVLGSARTGRGRCPCGPASRTRHVLRLPKDQDPCHGMLPWTLDDLYRLRDE